MRLRIFAAATVLALLAGGVPHLVWAVPAAGAAAQSAIQNAVEQALRDERDLRRLTVSVSGTEATLTGLVPHLYAKNEAIRLALAVDGIQTVASEIELPEPVEDSVLSNEVARVISDYVHYTMWDYLDGSINEGVVTLAGSVTPDRDKKADLYRRIATIPGVQDYVDNIAVLSVARADIRLRTAIGRYVAGSGHFDRYVAQAHPPFSIIVNNGVVTLRGYVRNQIEYLEMERIIRHIGGVLRVDNQLEVVSR